ncbi:unnamed protein product [Phyllotreta striolata]|uniref:Stress-activated map kinase-interacting protein 1 n=1 Tax=Phyllotreta striolata TaxID=444603 RepID=A0A9N9U2B0_PHYSR|nr:unnamed protein product [Phyllotreta striolata]
MALYDNKYWLLSHIRSSFISTDDTGAIRCLIIQKMYAANVSGMCELVMSGESRDVQTHLKSAEPFPDPDSSEDDEDDFLSYDLQMDADFNIRERSNTAAQIEKFELARKRASKTKSVKWESKQECRADINELFVRKDLSQMKKPEKLTSKLSALIQSHANVPKNPFVEFAKFDGTGQVNIPTKKYKIYLTMLPAQQRNYPMPVCCVSSAKVKELIGLILLKYSYNYGVANMKDVNHYGLYITEEDGEVDSDFPCLDYKEPISKYGFACLGLVEHKEGMKSVSFPEETHSLVTIEEINRNRTTSERSKADETKQMENDIQAVENHNKLMEAPLYRSFRAFMVSKVKPKIEVNIGVSGERIEIDPVPQKGTKLLPFKAKSISHPMENIAHCELTEDRSNKSCFRIVYSANSTGSPSTNTDGLVSSSSIIIQSPSTMCFKNYDFESSQTVALDLVQKMKLILELKSSQTREEYLATKEKKLQKKKSFQIVK